MFFYHFLQLCPQGHISKMLAVTVIKYTVTKRLWNFQIHFLPYSNAFKKKFFFQTCSFIIFFNFVPEVISRKCLLYPLLKTRLLSAFGIFKSISCLIRMRLRKKFFFKHVLLSFFSTLSRGHIPKMFAVSVIKNTVTKRLWNFQIRFLPY